ncbi:MAG: L-rhamnose isomerase, partial [Bacteroidales bacterium]|nr:L-rhamnose isomerase [Bacteroidales bacterium]
EQLRNYEGKGQYFERLALLEEAKGLPWNAVWDYFCLQNNVAVGEDYIADIRDYEKTVLSLRK